MANQLSEVMASVDWFSFIGQTIVWIKWGLISLCILGVMTVIYYFITYNISGTIVPLYRSGEEGNYSFGKPKKQRFCWNKGRTHWKPLFPLFNKNEVKPFDAVYPGNKVFGFEYNKTVYEAQLSLGTLDENNKVGGFIKPVPYAVREWQAFMYRKHEQEFAKSDWWSENKTLFIALACSLALLVAALVFIYLTYKMAMPSRDMIGEWTNALKNVNTIPGKG